MTLSELVTLTYHFHRVLYVSLTQKCPIRCRHCFVDSGPERSERVELDAFRTWIDGAASSSSLRAIIFSGGEPFSFPAALRAGLDACIRHKRYSVIATSAFWAKTEEAADRFLASYPRTDALWVSTDVFHEEFVPLSWLRNATLAATSKGIDVFFQVVDHDPQHTGFLSRFERDAGVDIVGEQNVYLTPLSALGRAAVDGVALTDRDSLAEGADAPCPYLGTPWLHEDGLVCACPNLKVHQTPGHALQLGNIRSRSFEDMSRDAGRDPFLQALRVLGPRSLLQDIDPELAAAVGEGQSICDFCSALSAAKDGPQRVRQLVAAGRLSSRIAALRMAMYSEVHPIDRELLEMP